MQAFNIFMTLIILVINMRLTYNVSSMPLTFLMVTVAEASIEGSL